MSGRSADRPHTNPLRTSMRNDKSRHVTTTASPNHPNSPNSPNSHSRSPSGRPHSGTVHRKQQRPGPDGSYASKPRHKKMSILKGHFVAMTGEFVGTILFLWFAFAWHQTVATQNSQDTTANHLASASTVLYISLGYGFSLLVAAFSFYRISGGLFNPAVALGLILTGSIPPVRGLLLIPAELLGGIVAAGLVSCMFPGPISVTETTLAPGVSIAQGVFIEMFLTSLLVFTIHMLAAEKSKVTFIAPLGIGLSLFVAELAGVGYTGGSLNPARSLGPAVVAREFPGYFWIYFVGPFLGSLLSAGFFKFCKLLDYEHANPGQDSADGEFVGEKV